jgi:hypothetical protein
MSFFLLGFFIGAVVGIAGRDLLLPGVRQALNLA